MTVLSFSIALLLLACVTWQTLAWSNMADDYVKDACNVTQYQDLCIHSLAPFSKWARQDPCRWAQAAVSVTTDETKRVTHYVINLKKNETLRGTREQRTLSDCIECFGDSIDNLHKSLGELRSLKSVTFDTQMKNVQTWMSAGLTSEDTCLDGFNGYKERQVKNLCNRVLNVTYMNSNALALVNKLAEDGGGSINTSP
ncbi:hypothetical protein NE237_013267 [Protea cynaroides]|uniref:Pectinesterase inhibitor domain-containing protein n=1 Tax=Protea cynaroides TaxID=273540 RepID=A0A9Q0H3J3_9MAGN|nr:hypothetical protein NE237_013267 [Protea cynaroides]